MSASTPLLPTFARSELAFERGEGAWLYTADGKAYLDMAAGIAVNSLGHAHPHLVDTLKRQADKLWHVSNMYTIPEQTALGRRLVEATGLDYAFFANSGAEANEGAIKTARKYQAHRGRPERYRIVTFEGAFHTDARSRPSRRAARRSTSTASARRSRASIRSPSATTRR